MVGANKLLVESLTDLIYGDFDGVYDQLKIQAERTFLECLIGIVKQSLAYLFSIFGYLLSSQFSAIAITKLMKFTIYHYISE